jgi:hypothetical protein
MKEADIQIPQTTRGEFRYVLVGNIIANYYYGENKEIKTGTKHFRAEQKNI